MRHIAKLAFVQALIFMIGLVCIELALRYIKPLPVHGGSYHARDGKAVRVAQDSFRLKPNLEVTHVSSEFSALIHTNELGYRKLDKESTTPQFLFLGDSFTFGHGVADDETFSNIFCNTHDLTCLNLGRSGTSTFDQLQVLKYAIDFYQVRPKTVALVMLTACWIGQSGNDLGGNLSHYNSKQNTSSLDVSAVRAISAYFIEAAFAQQTAATVMRSEDPTLMNSPIKTIQRWVGNFEITKRTMLILSGRLKRYLYECSDQETIDSAMAVTQIALNELERLATEHQFDVKVFAIHPYQELDGSYRKTESELHTVMPKTFEYIMTGERFHKEHYFQYDGHFNAAGHANMASIIQNDLAGMQSAAE